MLFRFSAFVICVMLGSLLLGCERTSQAEPPSATVQKDQSDPKKNSEKNGVADEKKSEKPDDKNKSAALKDCLEKYRFRWSDEKESDFPLEIKMESQEVPKEILGPFPADAPWRSKEKSEAKQPEKKSKGSRPRN